MIDISADLAEGSPNEDAIWPLVNSANVACGGHVGDSESMAIASRMARKHGVNLGAHPSYPDRENFGRKSMSMPREELRASLLEQIGSLQFMAEHFDVNVTRVKAHGALYNDAHRDRALADALVDVIIELNPRMAIVCSDRSEMASAARSRRVPVIREAFADRRYEPDGSLMSRSKSGSLLSVEEAAAQAELLAHEGVVIATDGSRVAVPFDTLCVHADMEHAVERLQAIRTRLAL
ncbi:MAG TPA: 5-oxoprolinase subunit PxpA [Thermoanaerobaculia bacterium]|nr:5-oxoprolinase subunit PxpA [Thermoanaerobaculia bacterium]